MPLARTRVFRLLVAVLMVLPAAACNRAAEDTSAGERSANPAVQPDDVVDLTLYFRNGNGRGAYLVPVAREVPISDDLPRTALELLLRGPVEEDGRDVGAALPPSTTLRALEVDGGIATVDLSADAVTDAEDVGAAAENEVLALAAIANTLTEFPGIERVRVLVEGEGEGWKGGVNVGAFWGSWGLPDSLARDDSVIGEPREGDEVPDVTLFNRDRQEVGSSDLDPVTVASIKTRERTTYVRVVVELADGRSRDTPPAVPAAAVRERGDRLVLEVDGILDFGDEARPGQRLDVVATGFGPVSVDSAGLPGSMALSVEPEEPRPYRLHTLASPTRIVLDIQK